MILRALTCCCNTKPRSTGGRRTRLIFSAVMPFLLLLMAGCGKKAQVKAPPPLKPATAPAKKAEPPVPSPPPVRESAPPAVIPAEGTARERTPKPVQQPTPEPASGKFVPGPLIRIGLSTEAKQVRISSSGGYSVMEKTAEASKQLVNGEIQVRVEHEVDEVSDIYRVQVGSFTNRDLALDLQRKLSATLKHPVVLHENAEAGLNQVRVGEFSSKEEAQSAVETMVESGYPGAFVVREEIASEGGGNKLALRGPESLFLVSGAGFLFQPSSGTVFLFIDGKPYRGVFDVSLNKNGSLTVVNQLGIEDYLLGVVPAEINPSTYPEFAALAAQSIAARTYAMRNLGRYRSQGFDLTNDTRTQVYGGVSAERDPTSDAVRRTSGLAIYYQDKLIDAMYMSTCGGRTEDFSYVFDAAPVPYLKSVFCAVENGPEKGETVLYGKHDLEQIILVDDGSVANRNLEFARALGLMPEEMEMSPEFLTSPAEVSEITRWVDNARTMAQKPITSDVPANGETRTRAGFLRYAGEAFFGAAEMKRRMSPRDVDYYMGNLSDGNAVPEPARLTLSYLIQNGLWRPYADNTVRPKDPVRRGDALSLLLNWVEAARPDLLRKGTFVSAGPVKEDAVSGSSIIVKWGNRAQEFRFAQNPYLFRLDPGRMTPVSSVQIIGNEKLSFHLDPKGMIDFLEIELSPAGASSDRYSPVSSWDTTLSRASVTEKLRGLAPDIGELKDLKPYQIGDSGRAVKIQVIGSRGSAVLNGYRVRNALGLRDTLFTLTRGFNPDGSVASFTFHGRGWGHGVGLCQVGAFGMARAGRNYEEIIKTYYQGVDIRKAY